MKFKVIEYSILKENKGISLMVLVITIIILLILAGITISQLKGSKLFENARQAKETTEEAQKLENEILEEYESEIGQYTNGARSNLQSLIIYPNGTESNPAVINADQRIEIDNPYKGHSLYLSVQINVDGLWGTTDWFCDSGHSYGIEAIHLEGEGVDKIVIQAANTALTSYSNHSGNGFGIVKVITSAPYRVKIFCLD